MPGTALAGSEASSSKIGVPAWTALTPQNGWTNVGSGQVNFQWRYWPLLNELEVIGTLAPGTTTDATVIGGPLSPTPASIQNQPIQVQGNSAAPVQSPTLTLVTSGNLQIFHMPTGVNEIAFHVWFSVDA